MKYYRLMSPNELEKFLSGEILNRSGRKKWFSEESYFYFFSEENGGFSKLKREFFSFFEFDGDYVVVEFESNENMKQQFVEDYNCYESVCTAYSARTLQAKQFCPVNLEGNFGSWHTIEQYHSRWCTTPDARQKRREREIQRRIERRCRGKR